MGVALIAEALNAVLRPGQSTTVLLETMAGKGSEVGRTFEELRSIIDRVEHPELLGVCLDTCHVYDGGYDLVNDLDGVLNAFERTVGLDRLRAVHLNDSKNPFSSHKDRHEKIGEGSIGLSAFTALINHPSLRNLPFYLETPQEDVSGYGQMCIRDRYSGTFHQTFFMFSSLKSASFQHNRRGQRQQYRQRALPHQPVPGDHVLAPVLTAGNHQKQRCN